MILNNIWYILIGIVFIVYVILDGFDLGVGILNRFLGKTDKERKNLYYSIGPFWDGNEVWLLTGVGALFAAFPIAYASIFSGFYLAFTLLLFFLILRIVSLEFRNKLESEPLRLFLDNIFAISSLAIVMLLGIVLGNIVRGLQFMDNKHYYGGLIGLLNPYSLYIGIFAVVVIITHGAAYTMLKFDGEIYIRALRINRIFIVISAVFYTLCLVLTKVVVPLRFSNFYIQPLLFTLLPLPFVFLSLSYLYNKKENPLTNFVMSSLFIVSLLLIFGVGNYPYLVPTIDGSRGLDIYNSTSSSNTLRNMLIIVLIGLPLVIFYTIYVYRIFKGKVETDQNGY